MANENNRKATINPETREEITITLIELEVSWIEKTQDDPPESKKLVSTTFDKAHDLLKKGATEALGPVLRYLLDLLRDLL